MFYKIVQADNLILLTKLVQDLLQLGWSPIGGIAFDGQNYLQALTRS